MMRDESFFVYVFSLEISGVARPKFPCEVRICKAKHTCGGATFPISKNGK